MTGTNFFERQDRARRATRFLVVWFGLAVIGVALTIYAVVMFAFSELQGEQQSLWNPEVFFWVFCGTLVFVGGASLLKSAELGSASGEKIARELGGVPVAPDTQEPLHRRFVNVVQEMSIASGVMMPEIFVLQDEPGINAFAAGTRPDNAAIAVSQGALEKLSRDELQAVVGHEFSHILNGDMRMNVKLIGWIFGLLALSVLGRILMMTSSGSRSRKNEGGNALALVGLAVFLTGIVGQFFASIIQASISRHRERLADASATQFTRNPQALANALARIGGDSGYLQSPRASEFSHFFFTAGVSSMFATHPPLEERIRALNPSWDGKFLKPLNAAPTVAEAAQTPPPQQCVPDRNMRTLCDLAKTSQGARALVMMLMMTHSPDDNNVQAGLLLKTETESMFRILERNWAAVSALPAEKRLSLVIVAAPQLRAFPQKERRKIYETLEQLAATDGQIAFFEFLILHIVKGVLFAGDGAPPSSENALRAAEIVFSAVMRENAFSGNEAHAKLTSILEAQSFFPVQLRLLTPEMLSQAALGNALDCLRRSPIIFRENLIRVCAKIAEADGKVSDRECDLLNAVSLALDCPVYRRIEF